MNSFVKKQLLRITFIVLLVVTISGVFANWQAAHAQFSVTISSGSTSLSPGGTTTFSATTDDQQGVVWTVSDGAGTIDPDSGFYTATSTVGTYTVYATSKTEGSVSDSKSVDVTMTPLPPTHGCTGTIILPQDQLCPNTDQTPHHDTAWTSVGSSADLCPVSLISNVCKYYIVAPTPPAAPVVNLSASPNAITAGMSSTITWSSTDATSCSASTVGTPTPWTTSTNTSGSALVTPTSTLTYYIMSCSNSNGNTSATTSVYVQGMCGGTPPSGGNTLCPGTNTTPVSPTNWTSAGSGISSCYNVGSNVCKYYTASSTDFGSQGGGGGGGGGVNNPPALYLTPASTTIQVGGSLKFQVVLSSASTSVNWSVKEGSSGGTISQFGDYIAPFVLGTYHIIAATTYAAAQATVNVVSSTTSQVSISLSPSSVNLLVGGTQQFTAIVLNASTTLVLWNLSATSSGLINSNGLFAAISKGVVIVTATSVADPTKIATSTVTVNLSTVILPPPPVIPVSPITVSVPVVKSPATTTISSTTSTTSGAETRPTLAPTIAQAAQQAIVTVQLFTANTASTVVSAIKTQAGSAVVNGVTAVGVVAGASTWTLSSLLASPMFASPVAASEVLFVPLRLWGLFLSALGLKRRSRPWGTVYDSVTKMPIDPALVTLYNEAGKKVATSITDLDGRFGFMVPKGAYQIAVQKSNYVFPSQKLAQKTEDQLYNNLYFGDTINVTEDGSVIYKNIPMDQKNFDWNEFAKNKMGVMQFHSVSERLGNKIGDFIFWLGFVVGFASIFVIPHVYSFIIFSLYIILIALRATGIQGRTFGTITDNANHPLSFATVSIFSKDLHRELFKKVADQYGRYYALVPKGEYEIKISRKNADESYTGVYETEVNAKNGVINSKIKV